MKRLAAVNLLSVVVLSLASGCMRVSEPSRQAAESSRRESENVSASYELSDGEKTVVVIDRLNRTVRIANTPKRIVTLSPATTELLFAIGAGSQIVGATQYCDYPGEAADLPRVGGGTLESLSREKILELEPDLVLCKWDNHEPLIHTLDRFNLPSLAFGPETLEQLYRQTIVLGRVTRCELGAERLVAEMKDRVVALTSLVSNIPKDDRRTVFYELWDEPLMSAGSTSFIGELLRLAGTRNIFEDMSTRYPKVSAEVVVASNPDVILSPTTHATEVDVEKILKRQGWGRVTAVRERQVFLIDGDQVSRCGPRLIDALEEVIRIVYPERYGAVR